ncbi:XAC2610-related protein [Flavobacterium kingsejongi]|uniref:VCBS repeat-containing protein n=1 Tax=Flavobacterium kingsejongi TaxID=1678728 RepID=A0A2S1LL13_9FLAO|nr:hypothetical protein [Flavobacterium kingsejongi]AWG24389.1 hypothetical protein FK004_03655 [Flavobacterium kingsejongi]
MNKFLPALALIISGSLAHAQQQFSLSGGSANYDAVITVENCTDGTCEGKGTIVLTDKQTGKLFQALTSEDLYFFLNNDQQPSVNIIQLYNEQSPLIFQDFNFDGTEDLAVRNGNNSSYGGPSYDVYVYNKTRKQLVISDELTALAYENLGMFYADPKTKRITTFSKSGCCWHMTSQYEVVPNKGLVLVSELEEDAQGGEKVIVTTRKWVKKKWVSKSKSYPIKTYYKE